jgi:hypothetical protein
MFRYIRSSVILYGFVLAGWYAWLILAFSHDNDRPGSFHYRLYPWDSFGAAFLCLVAGLGFSAVAFARPHWRIRSWTAFVFALAVLVFHIVCALGGVQPAFPWIWLFTGALRSR